ncbi:MAG: hypothetical protein AB8B91_22185, partial [Rubripirellula sp.]
MSNETETQTDPPSTSAVCLTTTWDGQLVLLGTIVTIQLVAAWWPPATVLTAIPLLALANRTHSPASNATRPSRFYLACLLIAGTSVLGELREIASFLSAPTDDSSGVSAASLLATAMPRMIARVVIPFAAGLVGLIIFGQLEAGRQQAGGATISTQWVQRLS